MTSGFQSFFKISLQLGTDLPPILTVACPFFRDIHHRQIHHFQETVIRLEEGFVFGHFSQLAVESFDRVCGIDQPTNWLRILEVHGKSRLYRSSDIFHPIFRRILLIPPRLLLPLVQCKLITGRPWVVLVLCRKHNEWDCGSNRRCSADLCVGVNSLYRLRSIPISVSISWSACFVLHDVLLSCVGKKKFEKFISDNIEI